MKMSFDRDSFSGIIRCAISWADTICRCLTQYLWIVNCRLILYNCFIVRQSLSNLCLVTSRTHLIVVSIIWVASTVVSIGDRNHLVCSVAAVCKTELVPGTWLSRWEHVVRVVSPEMGVSMWAMGRWDDSLSWIEASARGHKCTYLQLSSGVTCETIYCSLDWVVLVESVWHLLWIIFLYFDKLLQHW
jgi:hypothetical protein